MGQQLEGRLNRAQDILKRLEGSPNTQAVEGEEKVCICRSHMILNHEVKVLEVKDSGLDEIQMRAIGRWMYLMRYYPENWVSNSIVLFSTI